MTENDRYYYDSTRSIHSSIIGVEIFNDVEKPRRFPMAAIDQNSLHRGELKVFNAHTSNHQKSFRRASSVFLTPPSMPFFFIANWVLPNVVSIYSNTNKHTGDRPFI